jgi:hypothetical protein
MQFFGALGRGLPALTGASGRGGAVVAVAAAGGTVAYLHSYPRTIPPKDPTDKK